MNDGGVPRRDVNSEVAGEGASFASPDPCLHARFERQVLRAPDAVALVCQGVALSYAELNARANRLAHHLLDLGVAPGQLVGLHVERGIGTVVGILAILKAGGAYLPLDPVYPAERIRFMLEDSQAPIVISDASLADGLAGSSARLVLMDAGAETASGENPTRPVAGEDLAYVIYTSGSTGKPKGVQITHHNVTRLFDSTAAWYRFGPCDVWTLFHSYSFDFSVWEIWGALLYGGRVVVVPQEVSRSTEAFRELLVREGVTVLNQTPSAFRQLIKADMAGPPADYALRYVIFGGEALEYQSLRPWFDRYGDRRPQLVNMYGITETTVHVTWRPVSAADLDAALGSVIGEPIPDLQLYILNAAGEIAATGETGEMYVGGAGVAKGYLNRPELTAERFLADPFSTMPGARLYRTGDLARRLVNGEIEYQGRIDHQVKIRGFRIELGEIEASIATDPAIREVAVLAREEMPGDWRLVAYVVAPGFQGDIATRLRDRLRVTLPEYMVPSWFVTLEALPLTENGKVDRRALPAPDRRTTQADYKAPETPQEALVARVWGEVLGLERIGTADDFFALGGHSLLVIDVIQRLRAEGLCIEASQIFLTPTVAAVAAAAVAEVAGAAVPPNLIPNDCLEITPAMLPLVTLEPADIARIVAAVPGGAANIQDIYPLAPLQEGMLFHHRMGGAGDLYLVSTLFAAPDRAAIDRYLAALQQVIDRHDVLRTAFLWEGLAEPVQVVCRRAPLDVAVLDLDPAEGDIAGQLLARFDPQHVRIDLGRAPVIRIFLAHDPVQGRWVMLRLHHHLMEDHTADEIISEEIIALLGGAGDSLPEPLPYRNFVAHARQVAGSEAHRRFFTAMLGDVDEPTLPFGLSDATGGAAPIHEARRPVEARLAARLRRLAHQNRVGAASLFHLAWARVVAQCSGREDVVFGTVLFGRMHAGPGAERIVGPLINTLPLRLKLGHASVAEALRQTHEAMAALLSYEQAALVLAQGCSGVAANAPLFSALINYRHLKIRAEAGTQLPHAMAAAVSRMGLELLRFEERTNFPFELSVDDIGDGFLLEAQVQMPIDPQRVCAYMHRALEELAAALETAPDRAVGSLDILPAEERQLVVAGWNDTARDYAGAAHAGLGRADRLHLMIEAQAAATPDAVALEFEGETLSYDALNRRANQLARVLRARGVGPDVLVGVFAERSFEMVLALLAVLKAGGAYVPLDPSYPADRLGNMLEDARAPVVLAQPHIAALLPETAAEVLLLAPETWALQDAANLPDTGSGSDLAYVLFTSGSTGRPKGAMNEHGAICNRLLWMQEEYGLTPADHVLQKTPFSFDVSVWEFFWPLMVGARLVIARPEGHRDAAYLVDLIRSARITTLHFVPSMLRIFVEQDGLEACTTLRLVMCSGEALPYELVKRFLARLPAAGLHNLYGPTEAAVDVTYWPCRLEPGRSSVPIGYPVANTQIYILDTRLQPVPVGVVGEIFIGGVQVGRGYVGRDDLTAARFLPDPFAAEVSPGRKGARLYRTGDLGKHLPDGAVEYLGRTDFQVKIRGQRIELGEIEAVLDKHPRVGQSVVMARPDPNGGLRLVAYVVPLAAQDQGPPEGTALRDYLAAEVPSYMVPAAFVVLEALPLTSSGKVDRKALPEPGPSAARDGYVAPRTPAEADLARIFAEVLSLETVGIHDNFFELGGHSLLAIGVIERMRRIGLKVDVRTIFTTPTVAELAAAVGEETGLVAVPPNLIPPGCTEITPEMLPLIRLSAEQIAGIAARVPGGMANIQDIYPLATLQEGFLFHHRLTTEGDLYIMATQFAFDDRASLDRYIAALQFVIDRNDILRTAFFWDGLPEPVQVVCRQAPLVVEEVEVSAEGMTIAEALLARFNLLNQRFDMQVPPMIRIYIAQDKASGRWIFHQLTHHMMDDQTSVNLQEREIEAYLQARGDQLPTPTQFRNYVAQARLGLPRSEHETFFRDMLSEVDEPTAPFGFSDVLGNGGLIHEERRFVDPDLARRLFAGAQKIGVSTASLFHEAFALMIARLSGREDVVFGTVLLGRMLGGEGAGRIIGPCINTLPVRIALGELAVQDGIRRTHMLLARLLRHEHAPLSMVQRNSAIRSNVPVFNSILNYRRPTQGTGVGHFGPQNQTAAASPDGPDLSVEADKASAWFSTTIPGRHFIRFFERTNYPLTLSVDDFGDGFRMVAQVQAPIDPDRVCGYMQTALEDLAAALDSAPERGLNELTIMPEDERHRLLVEWNDTAVPLAPLVTQDLIRAQMSRTPDRVAVKCGDEMLSYAGLDARANRIARALRDRGIGRGALVGLCVGRNADLPAALLGIFRAGAAYVPLDPAFPADRLQFMVENSGLQLLLSETALAGGFGLPRDRQLLLDGDAAALAALSDQPLPPDAARDAGPEDPAYVIYTSGSTGTPKGVVIPHRAVVNMLQSMAQVPGIKASDVLMAVTTLSFDISVLELLLPLTVGAAVAVASSAETADAYALAGLIARHGANILQATPVTWRLLLMTGWTAPPGFKALVGGESLPRELAEALIGQGVALWNMYGPTETTVWSTCCQIRDAGHIGIGGPIANTRTYVLDKHGQPCAASVPGELYIGGAGMALGYWRLPELTAERFLPDPFQPGATMFRTGDSACWREDGTLDHLGRLDFQVKIRGRRIELGEIEARIDRHPGVRASVVIVREDQPGDQRLVAYLTARDQAAAPGSDPHRDLIAALRSALQDQLPDYMVPSAFVVLAEMPLTPNAKIDRRALPAPVGTGMASQTHTEPETPVEEHLAAVWAEALNLQKVSVTDDFFELGGHSLLALEVLVRAEQRHGIRIPVRAMLEGRTIRRIAQMLDNTAAPALPNGIVSVRQGDATQTPLFCIPGIGGVALQYERLAARMHTRRPIYAIEMHDFDFGSDAQPSLSKMAATVVHYMRQVQKTGPYAILGYSFGGNLAVEVAAELESQGQKLELVCVIDSYAPGSFVIGGSAVEKLVQHVKILARSSLRDAVGYIGSRVQRRLGLKAASAVSPRDPALQPPETELQRRLRAAAEMGSSAFSTYLPRRFKGQVALMRALVIDDWVQVRDTTGTNGWNEFCCKVEVMNIKCRHLDLFKDPHITTLAECVDNLLMRGEAVAGAA